MVSFPVTGSMSTFGRWFFDPISHLKKDSHSYFSYANMIFEQVLYEFQVSSTTTGLYLSIPMVWEEGQIDLNQKADHLVPPLNHHSPKGKERISDLSLPNSRRGYSPFSSLAGWRSMNEATEGISHYVELLTAVANLLGLRQLLYFSLKREER